MKPIAVVCAFFFSVVPALAEDKLLEEALEFTAEIFYLQTAVPGVIIGGIREGKTAVFGVGETKKGSDRTPDGDTAFGVGSITKSFTGLSLAHLVSSGTVELSDPVGPLIDLVDTFPERDGKIIRLVDLATHAGGFPRELSPVEGVEKYSDQSFAEYLKDDALLFAPGTGLLYSNIGFDVLGIAAGKAAGKPYADYLKETVLDPLGMASTSYTKPAHENVASGYDWNGNEMIPADPNSNSFGASGLYTTAHDMLRYLEWHLDRFDEKGMEARRISQAAWRMRDGLSPVYGLDESGHMDAMGLGWVIMMPEGDRPLIIQKAGGTNGVFSYTAFAPHRGVGIFMAINQFNFSAGLEMAQVVNELIATLAPR